MHLILIRPGAIGDTLLTFPVLKALRAQYSNLHITLVSNANVLPLALAFGVADEVSDYGDVQWSELFSTTGIQSSAMCELLKHTDRAICWLRDPDGVIERNLRIAGIQHVVTAPGRPPEGTHIHVVEYLAQTIGLHVPTDTHFIVSESGKSTPPQSGQIAIHPGSGGAHKCWPARSFAAVIERLWRLPGHSHYILLLGGPADRERIRDILSYCATPPKPGMLKVLVNEPLLEIAQQLQQCQCYLGNDSGITHLAAMLGVPTIALFGQSDLATWRPIGLSVMVIQESLLERLNIDVVMDAINSFCSCQET